MLTRTKEILKDIEDRIAGDFNINGVEDALGYYFDLDDAICKEFPETPLYLRSEELFPALYALFRHHRGNPYFKKAYTLFNTFEPGDVDDETFKTWCLLCYKNKGKPCYKVLARGLKAMF